MLAELDDPSELIPNVYDRIESNHGPGGGTYRQAQTRAYVNRLSSAQRTAIIEYFKYRNTFDGEYEPDKSILALIDFLRD